MKRPVSLAIVVSHPIQHYVPVYRELAKNKNIRLKVFYVAENGAFESFDPQFGRKIKWDVPLTEGYNFTFLEPGKILNSFGFRAVDSTNISEQLKNFEPDVIWINGYGQLVNWRALFASRFGARVVYTADSNIVDPRGRVKKFFKRFVVANFLRFCDHCLSYSPRGRLYLEYYGVEAQRIFDTKFPVDIHRLEHQLNQLDEGTIEKLRSELGFGSDHKILLFAGKLVQHKRPQDVVRVIEKLRGRRISALFLGSGEMESGLRVMVDELGLSDRIKFVGFVNQSELANYFQLSNVFVFPSEREPYGAVASEVLPFGLPTIAADNIGCIGASIIEGVNGLLYECGDIDKLAEQVARLFLDPGMYSAFSKASREMARSHDKSTMADCIATICTE